MVDLTTSLSMRTMSKLFFSCLFCLSLILLNGCESNVKEYPYPMGTREAEIQIGDNNTFKVSDLRGDVIETFSVVIHVSVLKADMRQFERQYYVRENKVIDRVTTVLRASTTEERQEAGNMAIKERIVTAINDVLEMPWVQEVFFTHITHAMH